MDSNVSLNLGDNALAFLAVWMVVILGIVFLFIVPIAKIFVKAGHPWWASLISGHNTVLMFEIANRPGWHFFLLFVPLVNLWVVVTASVGLAQSFGKGVGFGVGLLLLPFVFLPILGYGSAHYVGSEKGAPGFPIPPPGPMPAGFGAIPPPPALSNPQGLPAIGGGPPPPAPLGDLPMARGAPRETQAARQGPYPPSHQAGPPPPGGIGPGLNAPAPAYMCQMLSGPLQGQTIPLTEGQEVTLGRDPSVSHVILPPETSGISRKHVTFMTQAGRVQLKDHATSYGTFVDDQRLPPEVWTPVSEGQLVRIGDVAMTLARR